MKLDFITPEQAQSYKRKMPKSKVMQEYEGYLQQLPEGQIGKLEIDKKDYTNPTTVKVRLIRAGRSLGMDIKTRRIEKVILFWKETTQ